MQTGRMTLETQLQTKVWISIRDKIISSDIELNDKEKVAAEWCLKHQQPCGRFYRYSESIKLVVFTSFRAEK